MVTEGFRLGLLQGSASSSGVIFCPLLVSGYTIPELSITSFSVRTFSVIAYLLHPFGGVGWDALYGSIVLDFV